MGQSTPNVPSGVLPPAGGVTPLSRPLTGLTHNTEPFLDAKYLHPTANGAQRTGTEPPLMSAYFPKPRGTLPTTWAPYGWQVSCEKNFWEVREMALRIIEMYACAERKLVLNTINCIVKVRKTRPYGPVFSHLLFNCGNNSLQGAFVLSSFLSSRSCHGYTSKASSISE